MYNKNKKRKITWLLAAVVLLCILAMIMIAVLQRHTVKNVYVEGNLHYSREEIKEFVMQGPLGNNSLYCRCDGCGYPCAGYHQDHCI